jgi:hypothetical protein
MEFIFSKRNRLIGNIRIMGNTFIIGLDGNNIAIGDNFELSTHI